MKKLCFAILGLLLLALPVAAQERPSLVDLLSSDTGNRFGVLLAAVEAAGLTDTLASASEITVFAPTDDAFAAALTYLGISANDLLGDTETLSSILTYHVVPGTYLLRDLTSGPELETLSGETVQLTLDGGVLAINGTPVSDVDNLAADGVVVHAIDGVLLPPALAEAAAANRARIRIAHLSPDAGAVDVYLNDTLTDLQGITFGTFSDWIEIPGGAQQFALAAADDEPGASVLKRIEPGTWVTVAAIGIAETGDVELAFLVEDMSLLQPGQARVNVFHAIQNAPAIDVLADGVPLIINLAYPGTQGNNDGFDTRVVTARATQLTVVPFGSTEPVLIDATFGLQEGYSYFIAAAGTPALPQALLSATNLALLNAPATE